ncbi:hypothetical protein SHIRM173S_02296 [Streptomyces hirsutus]
MRGEGRAAGVDLTELCGEVGSATGQVLLGEAALFRCRVGERRRCAVAGGAQGSGETVEGARDDDGALRVVTAADAQGVGHVGQVRCGGDRLRQGAQVLGEFPGRPRGDGDDEGACVGVPRPGGGLGDD